MKPTTNILIAPLNWGLGHATRCMPLITALLENGYNPILASDGNSLALLKKEFPDLTALELPSYKVKYAKKPMLFKWKLLINSPKIIKAILKEKKIVNNWVQEFNLSGIISDNRLGLYSKKIPSVIITHQLNVLSGKTTWISTKMHQFFIQNFDECWVPDLKDFPNLSGKLGHNSKINIPIRYLGVLSRLEKKELPIKYDLMVILSGPEPQRTMLEEKILLEIQTYSKPVLIIQGKVESQQKSEQVGMITIYNFMQTKELEIAFNESKFVLCRSGYTTLMDLCKLDKKAFLIPTPGQYEQEYLAKKLTKEGLLPMAKQEKFKISDLEQIWLYKGLPRVNSDINWQELFLLFQSK